MGQQVASNRLTNRAGPGLGGEDNPLMEGMAPQQQSAIVTNAPPPQQQSVVLTNACAVAGPSGSWTVDQVCQYMESLELGHLSEGIRHNGIDGQMMNELSIE